MDGDYAAIIDTFPMLYRADCTLVSKAKTLEPSKCIGVAVFARYGFVHPALISKQRHILLLSSI